ncbi:peptidoglycan-binding domain-containing protein [Flavobacterium undicola]|uniref:peptidoglycan-binding domain-containing protein n=1 Tax=Flavobacterium undicola TaxID=1932779 RepID=UPI0015E1BD2D|nr:hypothetical protein [Flavobacterium undicola]MBA0884930.1 hypothetical protein [Flavobacterium undicola]
MIYINASESGSGVGLGKSKFLKKISIKKIAKQVSIKNAVKAVKFAAPIAAGFIPVGGGVASKLMNSKVGKVASKISKSKVAKKVVKLSKTKVGAAVVSHAKPNIKKKLTLVKSKSPKKGKKTKRLAKGSKGAEVKKLQESLGVEADGDFGPKTEAALQQATGAKSVTIDESYSTPPPQPSPSKATPSYAPEAETEAAPTTVKPSNATPAYAEETEPVGELTPVTSLTSDFMPTQGAAPAGASPKDNTLLYVGGAVALAGIVVLATKKSK